MTKKELLEKLSEYPDFMNVVVHKVETIAECCCTSREEDIYDPLHTIYTKNGDIVLG